MLALYRAVSWIAAAFVPFFLWRRARRGKEETARLGERFGKAGLPRPAGTLVWFHAASMGDSISIFPLIQRLLEAHPDIHILLTTVTVTSAKMAAARLPRRAFHQYAPVDLPRATERFTAHWRPDLAVWVESEFWPNQMRAMHRTGKAMLLLNARISPRSFRRWQKAPRAIRTLLSLFDAILAKSEEDADRLRMLGAVNAECLGNLKFSSPALAADMTQVAGIRERIGARPLWLAASTHPGEEEKIADAHQALRRSFPDLLTMIVPRHSARGEEIETLLTGRGLRVFRRGKGEEITPETEIYLADTMGELGIFYRLAGIVFVGGSLVPHGGQNPFEPARLHAAVLYGPHMHNFKEFCVELEQAGGAATVKDAAALAEKVEAFLRHPDQRKAAADAAFSVIGGSQEIEDNIFMRLESFLGVGA